MLTREQRNEHVKRVELGDKTKIFLQSSEWNDLVNPIISSMIKGLTDIRNLKSAEIDSEKKATVEVKARKMASEYLEQIKNFLDAYVIDGETSRTMLEKDQVQSGLYKVQE